MIKSSEDRALAFFEYLIISGGISQFREVFFEEFEESYNSTYRSNKDSDVIYIKSRWNMDDDSIKDKEHNFKDFLENSLVKEKKLSKHFIESRASKILSSTVYNSKFFNHIENTLIELNKKSKVIDYLSINNTIIELMKFYSKGYNKFHNFSKEYLDTLSVYREISKKEKITLSFDWKERTRQKELKYLYNSLINAEPPFINSSFETFYKAFTNQKLEDDETIKWLCIHVKNKKMISQNSLVVLLEALFNMGFIVSDLNDFNKTVENIFSNPNGVKLKNIKNTKQEDSRNPSRIQEIRTILDGLSEIA